MWGCGCRTLAAVCRTAVSASGFETGGGPDLLIHHANSPGRPASAMQKHACSGRHGDGCSTATLPKLSLPIVWQQGTSPLHVTEQTLQVWSCSERGGRSLHLTMQSWKSILIAHTWCYIHGKLGKCCTVLRHTLALFQESSAGCLKWWPISHFPLYVKFLCV